MTSTCWERRETHRESFHQRVISPCTLDLSVCCMVLLFSPAPKKKEGMKERGKEKDIKTSSGGWVLIRTLRFIHSQVCTYTCCMCVCVCACVCVCIWGGVRVWLCDGVSITLKTGQPGLTDVGFFSNLPTYQSFSRKPTLQKRKMCQYSFTHHFYNSRIAC